MLHELIITQCTNGTSIMNPFTFNVIDARSLRLHFLVHASANGEGRVEDGDTGQDSNTCISEACVKFG